MDELERRIRRARPMSGHRTLPLTDRAHHELQDLTESPSTDRRTNVDAVPLPVPPSRRRVLRPSLVLAAIVLVCAIALGTVFTPWQLSPAHAGQPPILEATPLTESASQMLAQLSEAASTRIEDAPGSVDTVISSESWSLSMEIGEDGDVVLHEVLPEKHLMIYRPDGSISMRVEAGEAFDDDPQPEGAPEEGELLFEEEIPAGEMPRIHADPVPTSADAIGDYLVAPYSDISGPLDSGEAFQEITAVMNEQELTRAQDAAVLEHLADLAGISVLGEVTDRLGREGIAFTATATGDEEHQQTLIVSPAGEILASEILYTGDSRPYLEAPSVVEYFAWNRNPTHD